MDSKDDNIFTIIMFFLLIALIFPFVSDDKRSKLELIMIVVLLVLFVVGIGVGVGVGVGYLF